MVPVAADFQSQTQWALVAMPAPIYFMWRTNRGLAKAL